MVCNKQKWSNCLLENDLSYLKRFISNKNGQVAFGEMKYSNKKWFIQFRNCVATLVELIQ